MLHHNPINKIQYQTFYRPKYKSRMQKIDLFPLKQINEYTSFSMDPYNNIKQRIQINSYDNQTSLDISLNISKVDIINSGRVARKKSLSKGRSETYSSTPVILPLQNHQFVSKVGLTKLIQSHKKKVLHKAITSVLPPIQQHPLEDESSIKNSSIEGEMLCPDSGMGKGFESFISNNSFMSKLPDTPPVLSNLLFSSMECTPKFQENLQYLIHQTSCEGVCLPGCSIRLSGLNFPRSFVLKGSAGTEIILKGPINIYTMQKVSVVQIIECNITVSSEPDSYSSAPLLFFNVATNCSLILQDCHCHVDPLASLKITNSSGKSITCINLTEGKAENASSLQCFSTSFSNFESVIKAGNFATVRMQKCAMSHTRAAAITLQNPLVFEISQTNFEKIRGEGIALSWTPYPSVLQNHLVYINNSNFCQIRGQALEISGKSEKARISILANQFSSCEKNSIFLHNLEIIAANISNNQIATSGENGIELSDCGNTSILIEGNKIEASQQNGIVLSLSSVKLICCTILRNVEAGIKILGSSKEVDNIYRLEIMKSHIGGNMYGVHIADYYKGRVILSDCAITKNEKSGIYSTLSSRDQIKKGELAQSSNRHSTECELLVQGGEVSQNNIGISISNEKVIVDGTRIALNSKYAVYLPRPHAVNLFAPRSNTIENKTIEGNIGGEWGTKQIYPRGASCGCSVCAIFQFQSKKEQ